MIPFHPLLLSNKDILVRWHRNVDKCALLCAFVHHSNIWSSLLRLLVRRKIVISQIIVTSPFSATGEGNGSTTCQYTITHTFLKAPSVPLEPPCLHASYINLSGQAKLPSICHTVSVKSPQNLYIGESEVLSMLCLTKILLLKLVLKR